MGRREEEEWEESDDGILDNWEEELEEAKPAPKQPEPKPAPKKPVAVAAVKEPQVFESEADRKRRLEQAVKRSDLQNTMDLFGVTGEEVDIDGVLKEEASLLSLSGKSASVRPTAGLLESSDPQSIPEFEKYAESIATHLNSAFGERKNYVAFLETLLRRLLSVRDITELRKLSGIVQDLVVAKQKEQQRAPAVPVAAAAKAAPAPAATKKKPSLLMGAKKGRDLDFTNYDDDDDMFDD